MGNERRQWAGGGAAAPPSVKRTRWPDWLALAAIEGAVAGAITLAALWRDLPGLPSPAGSLGEHALLWAQLIGRETARLASAMAGHQGAPAVFAESARTYAAYWASVGTEGRLAVEWRLVVAALAACLPAALTARRGLSPRDGLLFQRGSSRHEGPDAARELQRRFGRQARRRPDHPIAPNVPWPADMWTRHVLVVGGVGSGKSTFIRPLIRSVVESGEQALLFDPKGEFTEAFDKPAILAPWDARSLAWDIARDLRNKQDMRRFAASMVRESSDPMWANAARQLLVGLLVHLRSTRGRDWGWNDLAELVFLSQPELLGIMKQWHPEAVRAVERASVTTQGILINLAAFCGPILDLAEAWGATPAERRVSFRRWAEGKTGWRQIVLQGHGAYADLTKSYVEAVVGTVAAKVNSVEMRDDPSRKLWFIADELPQAGKIPIRALFEVGRSRGVRCVVACQDFAQLEEIHGERFVRALTSMCGTHVIGQLSPGETAERLCKMLGSRENERMNVSTSVDGSKRSKTVSFSRESVPLYSPSELASRLGPTPDGKSVTLLLFAGGDAHELIYPVVELPIEREAHIPAPWTLGLAASGSIAGVGAVAIDGAASSALQPTSAGNLSAENSPQAASDSGCGIDPLIADFLAKEFPQNDAAVDDEEGAFPSTK